MEQLSKKANGRSYIIQSAVGLGGYAILATIVTSRVFSAPQLSLLVQLSICGFLWGCLVWFAIVLRRYYKRLPDV